MTTLDTPISDRGNLYPIWWHACSTDKRMDCHNPSSTFGGLPLRAWPTCDSGLQDDRAGDMNGLGVLQGRRGDGVEARLQALHDGAEECACATHTLVNRNLIRDQHQKLPNRSQQDSNKPGRAANNRVSF